MLEPAAFQAFVDTDFRVSAGGEEVTLRLVKLTEEPSGPFRQFSLFFHGPPQPLLAQGTYEFRHEQFNPGAWFMVPIVGSNRERTIYQVCFSVPTH